LYSKSRKESLFILTPPLPSPWLRGGNSLIIIIPDTKSSPLILGEREGSVIEEFRSIGIAHPVLVVRNFMKTATEIDAEDIHRIVEMAWEDRTPFEAIKIQFQLPEKEVIKLMRSKLKSSSFRLWRKRVNEGVSSKHKSKRSPEINRFKSLMQK